MYHLIKVFAWGMLGLSLKNNLTNLILGFGARNIYNSNESFLFIDAYKNIIFSTNCDFSTRTISAPTRIMEFRLYSTFLSKN